MKKNSLQTKKQRLNSSVMFIVLYGNECCPISTEETWDNKYVVIKMAENNIGKACDQRGCFNGNTNKNKSYTWNQVIVISELYNGETWLR